MPVRSCGLRFGLVLQHGDLGGACGSRPKSDSGRDHAEAHTQREFDSAGGQVRVSGTPSYLTVAVAGGTAGDSFARTPAALSRSSPPRGSAT